VRPPIGDEPRPRNPVARSRALAVPESQSQSDVRSYSVTSRLIPSGEVAETSAMDPCR